MNTHFFMLILAHLLFVGSLFNASEGVKIGCEDWRTSGDQVCCNLCHAGNRLVTTCGTDPTKLCKPCEANTYITDHKKRICDVCNPCIDPQIQLEPCKPEADTVCGCKAGFRCGNHQCSFCVTECGKGQEPVRRGCRTCPKGTFNDEIHSPCKPWSPSCPKGKFYEADGDEFSDIKCSDKPKGPTPAPTQPEPNTVKTLPTKTKSQEDAFWPIVGIAAGLSVISIVFILITVGVYRRLQTKSKTETKGPMPETLPPEELIVILENDDACSYRQPEQEQGGSLESIESQDSESKLIV